MTCFVHVLMSFTSQFINNTPQQLLSHLPLLKINLSESYWCGTVNLFLLSFHCIASSKYYVQNLWKLLCKASEGVANTEYLFKEMELIKMHPLDLFLNGSRTSTDGNAAIASSYSKQKPSFKIERISFGFKNFWIEINLSPAAPFKD